MLSNLLRNIEWRHSSGGGKIAVICDESFSEAFKWNLRDAHLSMSPEAAEFTTFSPPSARNGTEAVAEAGFQGLQEYLLPVKARVTYFPLHAIKLIANPPDNQQVSLGVLAAHTSRRAQPVTLSSLSRASAAEEVDPREYHSVLDVNASDLPAQVKTSLKSLAHDLAGALVFDYDLDVSASVHALGKTSSILGHNILPILEQLVEQRGSRASEKRTQSGISLRTHLNTASGGSNVFVPLQPAALVLIDRTEDLLTPVSAGSGAGGATPLAHRILNTLNYCQYLHTTDLTTTSASIGGAGVGYGGGQCSVESLQCDVSLRCPLLEVVEADTAARLLGMQFDSDSSSSAANSCGVMDRRGGNWNTPMSALANLPVQLTPSLLYKPLTNTTTSNATHPVLVHLLAGTEEQGRTALCAEIKAHITNNEGVLPPAKKRGLGAEMLAYTQALIAAPGSNSSGNSTSTTTSISAEVTTTCTPLLSLAYCVIEGMQRSSQKQFAALCAWQCAFDVRTAREAELNTIAARMDDFDVCVAHLLTYFLNTDSSGGSGSAVSSPKKGVSGGLDRVGSAKSVVSEKEASSTAGPVDVVHILAQLLRLASLFRQRHTANVSGGGDNLSALVECLCDYLVHKSCEAELRYLVGLRFLATTSLQEVRTHRQNSAELDELYSEQIHAADSHSAESSKISPTSPEEIAAGIASLELGLKQLYSSVRGQVTLTLHALVTLQCLYTAQRGVLLEGSSGSGKGSVSSVERSKVATSECLDLLSGVTGDGEVVGLVARITQAYLTRRSANSSNDSTGVDPLAQMFEFVESPIQQMKRAGLGLLSKGLGSLGFGFGSQVASVASTPHPSEQPVLVLFVLGGVSYKEVGQVQHMLSKYAAPNTRVILLSTRVVSAENVLYSFFS